MKIYRQEYSEHWRKLLSELEILPPKDSNELKNLVHIVADPQSSPLTSLLDKAYEQTNFADFDPVLKQEIGLSENKGLAEFPDPKQTAETMKKIEPILADVGGYVRSAEMSGATSSAIQQAKTALEDLKSMAQQQTAPGLSKWLSSLGNDGDAILTKSIRNEFNKAWISEVYNVCEKSINNKYPLNPKSVDFIQLTEFEAFFGPNGTIEKFKEKHLQDQQLSSNVRNQFDRANNIKMMFFPSKRPGLGVAFHLIAKDNLDPRISLSQLDFGNDSLEYKHGPEISKQFTWPDVGANSVRLVLTPASAETMPVELTENGPWAWFHMLDKADIKPATDGYDVTFNVKGYKAAYHINTSINIKELREFHCPARLD
jgi:type VI secretion system protein ImpL